MTTSPPAGSSLGDAYDPFGAHVQDPYSFYAQARREEPVFFSPRLNVWVVTRFAYIVEVERNWKVFSAANAIRPVVPLYPATLEELGKGVPFRQGTIDSDGEEHRRYRSPLARVLGPDRVAAVEPLIRRLAGELVDSFIDHGQTEFMHAYAYPLPIQVIGHISGVDAEDLPALQHYSYATGRVFGYATPEQVQVEGARDTVALQRMLARYAVARHARPRMDAISEIVAELAPGDPPLTDEQINELVWHLLGLVVAGHTTTSSLLGSGLMHLLRERAQWELLCEAPKELIPRAVEEIARYDAAVQGFFRVTTEEATVGGVRLPAGAEVLVVFGSGSRDEAVCERPEQFDVTRPPTRHLAFGHGPHLCVGATLARAELRISLETLVERLPGLRLASSEPVDILPAILHRAPKALHVAW